MVSFNRVPSEPRILVLAPTRGPLGTRLNESEGPMTLRTGCAVSGGVKFRAALCFFFRNL